MRVFVTSTGVTRIYDAAPWQELIHWLSEASQPLSDPAKPHLFDEKSR
jgi:hypothetical protein